MKYRDFEKYFNPFKIFSTEDIKKKYPGFDSRRLVEWQQKEYIQKIINRWYLFSDSKINEPLLFLTANKIYAPSYISFDSALAFYGLIPETVFSIISTSGKKTKTFHTPVADFYFRHLKPSLIFGYRLESIDNQYFKIAEPEKAILDYLYLHPKMQSEEDFEAWRINRDWLEREIDKEKLERYLFYFSNKALTNRVQVLLRIIRHG